jgi:hypothetical protein
MLAKYRCDVARGALRVSARPHVFADKLSGLPAEGVNTRCDILG